MIANIRNKWIVLESDLISHIRLAKDSPDHGKQDIQWCKELPGLARKARDTLWALVRTKEVDYFQEDGEKFLATLEELIDEVRQMVAAGHPLRETQAELEQLRQEHLDRWLWFRKEEVDQALAEYERGEMMDLDDAFAQIANVTREEWTRRVEERKRCQDHGGE